MIRYIKTLLLLSCFFLSSCQRCYIKPEVQSQSEQWGELLAYAEENLPTEGTLIQKHDGYAYLKVSDNYIHRLFPRLKMEDSFQKPPFFRRNDAPGAHISVVYSEEKVALLELGKIFHFTLKNIVVVDNKKDDSYIILEVFSPELEELRKSYGLSPKLQDHEFHITLAKKKIKKP